MFFTFVHSRPLLRALLALVLFAGFLGTAAATHASLTSAHSVAASLDTAGGDLDTSELDDSVSAEDNSHNDMLDVPAALTVQHATLREPCPTTSHAAAPHWHASSELRPPIV